MLPKVSHEMIARDKKMLMTFCFPILVRILVVGRGGGCGYDDPNMQGGHELNLTGTHFEFASGVDLFHSTYLGIHTSMIFTKCSSSQSVRVRTSFNPNWTIVRFRTNCFFDFSESFCGH